MFFGPGYIQRCMFAFVLLTILSLILEGAWLGNTDYGTMRTLTHFSSYGPGIWAFPMMAVGFLMAIPQMLVWDYSWFASIGAIGGVFRLLLSVVISIGFVWGFATMIWPIVAQLGAAIARGLLGLLSRI
ncbi:hypothetical protein [Candidatus Magnetobacterium casense]|uniref:Uncharacterized protein n=1 Tax=Candidatus Magnetobacterium casense TaxID=1455061 RepID=A0ABS6RXY6_9BACT|nr:hypothetical protein [Candidatus Magnetobacterium casensis]MBV6341215.1 hypothetical protein [Candidatus Magnetobacterium casensis]